jgi:glycosyltransferase involved in cell wall biosynthesis
MLIIFSTHPIQYQVPLWRALAREGTVPFEVWYFTRHGVEVAPDPGFRKSFAWDLDMLAGYPHRFLAPIKGATPNSFWKCRTCESLAHGMRLAGAKAIWVQGWQVAGYWQAVWAAKNIGAEVWLRGESNDLGPTPSWKQLLKNIVLGQLFKRVDRFLYIGKANRRLYEKFGVAADRLYRAPYAVDNERFASQASAIRNRRSEIRGQWGISKDAFCVLFCGKFIPKKHPMDLIAAAQLLITNGELPNIHLLFVGSGELCGQLRASCDVVFDQENSPTSLAKPRATFAGFLNQTEISKAYAAADCLVLPSDYGETWGLVVNEAMASGTPCIISDQCGCAEDLGRVSGNVIFRCGDLRQLAERLKEFNRATRTTFKEGLPSFDTTVATVRQLYALGRNNGDNK